MSVWLLLSNVSYLFVLKQQQGLTYGKKCWQKNYWADCDGRNRHSLLDIWACSFMHVVWGQLWKISRMVMTVSSAWLQPKLCWFGVHALKFSAVPLHWYKRDRYDLCCVKRWYWCELKMNGKPCLYCVFKVGIEEERALLYRFFCKALKWPIVRYFLLNCSTTSNYKFLMLHSLN